MKKAYALVAFFLVSSVAMLFVFQNCGQGLEALDNTESGTAVEEGGEVAASAARGANIELQNFPSGLQIIEGGATLQVPVTISRGPENNSAINLSIRPAQPEDMAFMDYELSSPNLSAGQSTTQMSFRLAIANRPLKTHSRSFIVRADTGQTSSEKSVTIQVVPVDAPDIYLLVGQSNMVGSSLKADMVSNPEDAKYAPLDSPHPRVQQLNVNYDTDSRYPSLAAYRSLSTSLASPSFIRASDPIHAPLLNGNTVKTDTSIGPGLSFAKRAANLTENDVILVPAAWGGTGFCKHSTDLNRSWNPNQRSESEFGGTGLFDRAVIRANYTIQQTGGILRGILWNQGRHDSYNNECTRLYPENVRRLVDAFRSRIQQDRRGAVARGVNSDVPFLGATMSQGKDSRRDYSNPSAQEIAVDNVYRNMASTFSYADYVNMNDITPPQYPCGDGSCAHFGGRGYRIMGQRYYDALMRVFNRGAVNTGQSDSTPSTKGSQAAGLVNGSLYRWDGRNWVYRPGNVCKYTGNTSDVPAANNLDGNRTSANYLALRSEISGKTIGNCPSNIQINSGTSSSPATSTPTTSASGLISGTVYRWDGRNFLYSPTNTCQTTGSSTLVQSGNNLDTNQSSSRYLAMRAAVKVSGGKSCP